MKYSVLTFMSKFSRGHNSGLPPPRLGDPNVCIALGSLGTLPTEVRRTPTEEERHTYKSKRYEDNLIVPDRSCGGVVLCEVCVERGAVGMDEEVVILCRREAWRWTST